MRHVIGTALGLDRVALGLAGRLRQRRCCNCEYRSYRKSRPKLRRTCQRVDHVNNPFVVNKAAAAGEVKIAMCQRKKSGSIIFAFRFHCKRIVAIFIGGRNADFMGWRIADFSE